MVRAARRLRLPNATVIRIIGALHFGAVALVCLWLVEPQVLTDNGVLVVGAVTLPVALLMALGVFSGGATRLFLAMQVASVPLVSLLVAATGRPDSIVAVLYLWGPPYAFAVYGRRFGILQSALIGIGYGAVVASLEVVHPDLRAETRHWVGVWVMVVATVVISGLLTDRLTASARAATERLRRGFAQAVVGTLIVERDGTVREANGAFCTMVRRSATQIVGMDLRSLVVPHDVDLITEQIADNGPDWTPPRLEIHLQRATGGVVLTEADVAVVAEGGHRTFFYCQFRDVTEAREAHDLLARQAMTDALTQLPNRALLNERIRSALHRRLHHGTSVAVMLLDLDRFKLINDSFGHRAGDDLLVAIAERLSGLCADDHSVARLGGDEFVVVCEGLAGVEEVAAVAARVLEAVGATTSLRELDVTITTSIGVAMAPARTVRSSAYQSVIDPEDLLRHADVAMYQAKSRGGNTVVLFDETVRDQAMLRLRIEIALRHAVRERQLLVHYQPVVDLETGVWTGVEALVRWMHPERGLLSPSEFIAIAEESDLIDELGRFVLHRACREFAALRRTYAPARELRLAINVSVRQLARPGFAAEVAQLCADLDLSPRSLAVEITETLLMGDQEMPGSNTVAVAELEALRALGVTVLLDDFGTGFSSLSYLRRLPVDVVKVDRSFVSGVGSGIQDPAIVTAIVDLARALKLAVVAEGIESDVQWTELRQLGCTHGQGYLFGRAMPVDEIPERMVTAVGGAGQPRRATVTRRRRPASPRPVTFSSGRSRPPDRGSP